VIQPVKIHQIVVITARFAENEHKSLPICTVYGHIPERCPVFAASNTSLSFTEISACDELSMGTLLASTFDIQELQGPAVRLSADNVGDNAAASLVMTANRQLDTSIIGSALRPALRTAEQTECFEQCANWLPDCSIVVIGVLPNVRPVVCHVTALQCIRLATLPSVHGHVC
jgi:hypothetical protein